MKRLLEVEWDDCSDPEAVEHTMASLAESVPAHYLWKGALAARVVPSGELITFAWLWIVMASCLVGALIGILLVGPLLVRGLS